MADPERREGIDHRVHDGRRHADVAGLAESLGAERVALRRGMHVVDLGVRHVVGARQRVVHQRARQHVALGVEANGLERDLAPRLRERAVELTIGEQRVDDGAGVVDPHEPLEREHAGLALDTHGRHDRATAPHLVLRRQHVRGLEPGLFARRERTVPGHSRDVRPAHEAIRNAGDREAARAQPHVGGVRLEQMRGEPPRLRDDGVGRVSQRAAAERGAAAAEGPDAGRNDVGIAVTDVDRLGLETQAIGHDLREHGLVPLAVCARAGGRGRAPVGLDPHEPALPAERRGLDIDR